MSVSTSLTPISERPQQLTTLSTRSKVTRKSTLERQTLPQISTNKQSQRTKEYEEDTKKNPFTMPKDADIFNLREKEKQNIRNERELMKSLKVHQKSTYSSRTNQKSLMARNPVSETESLELKDSTINGLGKIALATGRDPLVDKESMAEFVSKKREMFLVQYSLGVKREEMRKLEELAQKKENQLTKAEKCLEDDATNFEEFLKNNNDITLRAINDAEKASKEKMEKANEIKRLNALIMSLKTDISKNEDTLKQLKLYRKFLDSVAPKEWQAEQKNERDQLRLAKAQQHVKFDSLEQTEPPKIQQKPVERHLKKRQSILHAKKGSISSLATKQQSSTDSMLSNNMSASSDSDLSDEEIELYFSHPQQLLDIFSELEEQNLSLIQNSQEIEEALEEMKQTRALNENRMNQKTDSLQKQITILEDNISKESKKAQDLEQKAKMFSYGEFKEEDQELLGNLDKKVHEVYTRCIGYNEANIGTLQMLTSIENRIEELFDELESLPPEKVAEAEQARAKERRHRIRESKLEEQRIHQEERVKRALERAKADPKKPTGKKLVFRSEPPRTKRQSYDSTLQKDMEEEEMKYFFS